MSEKQNNSLVLLSDSASQYKAKLDAYRPDGSALYELEVDFSDSSIQLFRLKLTAKDTVVYVQEKETFILPGFCPERHINYDGTFCLGWNGVENLKVIDKESAKVWWGKLLQFLRLQRRASKRRNWPGPSWAHGQAAESQHRSEGFASMLGQDFVENLNAKKFYVKRKVCGCGNGTALKLYIDGVLFYTVWEKYKRVANTRQPCICKIPKGKRRLRIRSCGNHASAAANLVMSLWEMQVAEEKFWNSHKGKQCCGTMNGCPLAC